MTTEPLPLPDEAVRRLAWERQLCLTKPPHSLGQLEQVAVAMAAFQADPWPRSRPCSALIFAADHPVTVHGISPYPSRVTRAMLDNFAAGGAAASVLAAELGVPLWVVDVGVGGESPGSPRNADAPAPAPGVRLERMPNAPDAGDILCEPALSVAGFAACAEFGAVSVQRHTVDDRVVILGEMGIGNTTPAAAVAGYLLDGARPEKFVGRGTGASGPLLDRKREVVATCVRRLDAGLSGRELLRQAGGREFASLYGAMRAALAARRLLLIDGFIVTAVAAALVLDEPEARGGMLFAHRSAEKGHAALLERLDARPLLSLDLCLGEASGALAALPLLDAACSLHRKMATFESAQVPNCRTPGGA